MLIMTTQCLTMVPPPQCLNNSPPPTTSASLNYEGHMSVMTSGLEETMKAALELERTLQRESLRVPTPPDEQPQVNHTQLQPKEEEEDAEMSPKEDTEGDDQDKASQGDSLDRDESSGFEEVEMDSHTDLLGDMDPLKKLQVVFGLEAVANGHPGLMFQQDHLKCSQCEYTCRHEAHLQAHMQDAHQMMHSGEDHHDIDVAIRLPKVNSQGKMKMFKCKQCTYVAVTKLDFWSHSRVHIRKEKQLQCPQCPFVTEYKHHLEYHLRNHNGSKPFKCSKCNYSCVNKSMLNSHMKSHSNVYQYRCANCSYATKYCHSLKIHLRKYDHKPDMVLNSDGTPNPLPVIDVYGTRRGPKTKKQDGSHKEPRAMPSMPPQQCQPMNLLPFTAPGPFPFLFPTMDQPMQLFPPMFQPQVPLDLRKDMPEMPKMLGQDIPEIPKSIQNVPDLPKSLRDVPHLSQPLAPTPEATPESAAETATESSSAPNRNRRKGKAFKLERIAQRLQGGEAPKEVPKEEAKPATSDSEEDAPALEQAVAKKAPSTSPPATEPTHDLNCPYCFITFKDLILYSMHMAYHCFKDPFCCNRCGVRTLDRFEFFAHIAHASHH